MRNAPREPARFDDLEITYLADGMREYRLNGVLLRGVSNIEYSWGATAYGRREVIVTLSEPAITMKKPDKFPRWAWRIAYGPQYELRSINNL